MSNLRYAFTPEHERQLRRFWPTPVPIRVLAERWHCSGAYISVKAKELGLPPRAANLRRPPPLVPECNEYFRQAARRRGISTDALAAMIVNAVEKDRLIDAVLDDGFSEVACHSS